MMQAWADYLESHAKRAYNSAITVEVVAAKAIIKRIRKGDLPVTFGSRDVWRNGWANLGDSAQVSEALLLLCDFNWLRKTKKETAGRTATIFEVNPKVYS